MTKDKKTSQVVGVRLTTETKTKIAKISQQTGVSISTLVRIAINRMVREYDEGGGISL